ncbi:uncharacterized protein LOC114938374 isoform X1 [Nylanderia fulva]|uniref:uncharacterized protein LOC114938374 isoform X1 n=1 Tax=Nylanderia fulva TaxID=613905 RepID=UPI0010FB6B34|nr:uncharacterized protein LOC114938374 isoform X1 [Nylanderia fulva]
MFKRHGKSNGHGRPKKESNTKKHHIRTWVHTTKKKQNEANLFVIMSSGEPSPPAQPSISTTSFDELDDARLVNTTPVTSQPAKPSGDITDTEAIEEAVPIVQKTLPVPQSKPEIERNGLDVDTKKSPDEQDVSCLINCIYYTQQCCDCTIV